MLRLALMRLHGDMPQRHASRVRIGSRELDDCAKQLSAIRRIVWLTSFSPSAFKALLLTSVFQAHNCSSGVIMSIPRNNDVKKHLARSVPRFITQEKDSEKPSPALPEDGRPVEHQIIENSPLKSEAQ